eukprot:m.529279 g.529279  ORF g.529279 m.529279 type:complete len:68 (-) comp57563_c0_seq48:2408-2611(-)
MAFDIALNLYVNPFNDHTADPTQQSPYYHYYLQQENPNYQPQHLQYSQFHRHHSHHHQQQQQQQQQQ